MRNIRHQLITIPEGIVEDCWESYKSRFINAENSLVSVPNNPYYGKFIHPTGAFQLPNNYILPDTKLSRFFTTKNTNVVTIVTETHCIFRGLNYFPDSITLPIKEKFDKMESDFWELQKLYTSSGATDESLIIYLATIDYLKNYLLILLHIIHVLQSRSDKIVDLIKENDYKTFLNIILDFEKDFVFTWEYKKPVMLNRNFDYSSKLKKVFKSVRKVIKKYSSQELDQLDLFRSYRENNNPIKLMTVGRDLSEIYLKNYLLIGIEYGGIELPFIVNAYREFLGKDKLNCLIVNLSLYTDNTGLGSDTFWDIVPLFIRNASKYDMKKVLLLDDSIMTGRTINIINQLLPNSVEEVYLAVLSMTLSNRYHHLTRGYHGSLNPVILDVIYSKYRSNYTSTYSKKSYTDKQGVFNLEKNSIKELLRESYFKKIMRNG